MKIDRLDHLVLTVRDVERSVAFYTTVLGFTAVTFGAGRRALAFGAQKINLHQHGREVQPAAAQPTPGSADLCLITKTPLAEVRRELEEHGVAILLGPVERIGATGRIRSVYFRDPDSNLIEIAEYFS